MSGASGTIGIRSSHVRGAHGPQHLQIVVAEDRHYSCTRWERLQATVDARRFVFIDETWAKTNITRLFVCIAPCQRLRVLVPYGHWNTMTFIGAPRCDGITAPLVLDGPINTASFLAYVEQVLVPTLQPGGIVVMNNPSPTREPQYARPCAQPAPSCSSCRLPART